MSDDGETKDDVKMPDGEIGEKINKLYKVEEKDTSEYLTCTRGQPWYGPGNSQQLTSLLPDVVILTAMGEEAAIEAKEAPRQS